MKLTVILKPGEDGWILAECPAIRGCVSQGRNNEEALENIHEAISGCLEALNEQAEIEAVKEHGHTIQIEVAV